ncbi:MAG: 5'-nucleotidase C-terminal domain-containing protein [Calditrichaeota bacterium]|nr:5'-nucleotidase C-terminal domain-containing protein [Calditrichota bacterium]
MLRLTLLLLLILSANVFATETFSVVICNTNDVHGGVDSSDATFMNPEFPPALGGGASLATLVTRMRAYAAQQGKGFLLIDTGDIFQGTLVGTKSEGTAVVRYMNEVKYDAWVPGNHEFDLGRGITENLIQQATFPVISSNIYDTANSDTTHFVQPYIIREFGGVKVGVIGITTSGTERASFEDNVKNLYFAPEVTTLAAYRDTLQSMGCNIIVAACHLGLPYDRWDAWDDLEKKAAEGWKTDYTRNAFELARRVPGIDVLFAGDIHVGYTEPWVDPVTHTPCFQGYGRGTNLMCVEFEFDAESGQLIRWKNFADESTLITLFSDQFPRDREIAECIDTVVARVEVGFNDKIGEAEQPITRIGEGESAMGNLVCDAMLWRLKGDIALTNKGGVRTDLPGGNITPQDVFNVLPFDNTLGAVNVTGAFIRDLLEEKVAYGGSGLYVAGMRVKIDRSRERGDRVVSLEIGGKPYDPEANYKLVTTDYLLEGNSGMEKLAALRSQAAVETGIYMREAIIEFIKSHSPLSPKLDGRWQFVDRS